jgi:hypothetical protein
LLPADPAVDSGPGQDDKHVDVDAGRRGGTLAAGNDDLAAGWVEFFRVGVTEGMKRFCDAKCLPWASSWSFG